jgi:hypothetical protein
VPSERRLEKAQIRVEKDRYRVHVILYDYPSRRSFVAFLGYFRWQIFQFVWVMWSVFWTGHALGAGHTFSFWLNGILTPFILMVTLFIWHQKVVAMGKTHLRNLQEIGRWMRRNGFDQDEPPFWLH